MSSDRRRMPWDDERPPEVQLFLTELVPVSDTVAELRVRGWEEKPGQA